MLLKRIMEIISLFIIVMQNMLFINKLERTFLVCGLGHVCACVCVYAQCTFTKPTLPF